MAKHYVLNFILLVTVTFTHLNSSELPMNPPSLLSYLYTNIPGSIIRFFITKPWLSKIAGWYANTNISRKHISSFIKNNNIDMSEALLKNANDYATFNEFFIRELEPSARPIDKSRNSIVSPSDGILYAVDNIEENTALFIKEKNFNLSSFFQDSELAKQFYGGSIVVIYLAPHNYHRFHFPFACSPLAARSINGIYDSVHPYVYTAHMQPLQENERQLILLPVKGKHIALVPVGALCVGQITETYEAGKTHKKGEQLGYFSFGGSTVVMVFPPKMVQLNKNYFNTFTPVKMGIKIGNFL